MTNEENNDLHTIKNTTKYLLQGILFDGTTVYLNDVFNEGIGKASFFFDRALIASTVYNGRNIAGEMGHPFLGGIFFGALKGMIPILVKGKVSYSTLIFSAAISAVNNLKYEIDKYNFPEASYFKQAENALHTETLDGVLTNLNQFDPVTNINDGFKIGVLVAIANPIYDFLEENIIDDIPSDNQIFGFIKLLHNELFYIA